MRRTAVRTLRRALLASARTLGVAGAVANSRWRRARLLILAYHGVSQDDEHLWNPELFVTPSFLRARFELIRGLGCAVLPLDLAVRQLYQGTLPPRAVVLTFDDGGADFARRVVPILQEFEFPATVYVSTYYAQRGGPVFDPMLRYLLWCARGHSIDGSALTANGGALDLTTPAGRDDAVRRIEAFLVDASADAKDAALRLLANRGGLAYDRILAHRILHLMTSGELAALPRHLVDVQLHTHRHRSPDDRDEFAYEVAQNREHLRAMGIAADRLTHFCYPSGIVKREYPGWLRDLGVRTATTCQTGLARRDDDPLLLPRLIDTPLLTTLEFESWLRGVGAALSRRRTPAELVS
jgi:peptidoglycan/xylan/chitin deacetylase (PgdA/CDA1 family)